MKYVLMCYIYCTTEELIKKNYPILSTFFVYICLINYYTINIKIKCRLFILIAIHFTYLAMNEFWLAFLWVSLVLDSIIFANYIV